jgi:protein CpxP
VSKYFSEPSPVNQLPSRGSSHRTRALKRAVFEGETTMLETTTENTTAGESNETKDRRVGAAAIRGSWRWLMLGLPLAFVLATSGARADNPAAPTDGSPNGAHEWHRGPRGGDHAMRGMRMHRLLGLAGATDAQKAQIKQIFAGIRPQVQSLRSDHMKVRQQIGQALTAPTVDTGTVERLRLEQVRITDQQSKLMTQALVKASQVLTPEQRQKIAGEIGKHAATK